MKFTLVYRDTGNNKVTAEDYDKSDIDTVEQAKDQAVEWLEDFNSDLRRWETERKFVSVIEGNFAKLINRDIVDYQNIKAKQLS